MTPSVTIKLRLIASKPPCLRSGRGIRKMAPDVPDVEAAGHAARAVGNVEVDAGDEAGARAGADGDVGAELERVAVVGDGVGVRPAVAGQLGDARAPVEAELLGGLEE